MSRPVVSAEDVRAARRRNELQVPIPPGAIVTPLAREEADRWGIALVPSPEPGEAPGRRRSTCDPDEVERVVDRVRTRVPAADPSVVRQIARRVLEEDTR